jgi:hypothetical protein
MVRGKGPPRGRRGGGRGVPKTDEAHLRFRGSSIVSRMARLTSSRPPMSVQATSGTCRGPGEWRHRRSGGGGGGGRHRPWPRAGAPAPHLRRSNLRGRPGFDAGQGCAEVAGLQPPWGPWPRPGAVARRRLGGGQLPGSCLVGGCRHQRVARQLLGGCRSQGVRCHAGHVSRQQPHHLRSRVCHVSARRHRCRCRCRCRRLPVRGRRQHGRQHRRVGLPPQRLHGHLMAETAPQRHRHILPAGRCPHHHHQPRRQAVRSAVRGAIRPARAAIPAHRRRQRQRASHGLPGCHAAIPGHAGLQALCHAQQPRGRRRARRGGSGVRQGRQVAQQQQAGRERRSLGGQGLQGGGGVGLGAALRRGKWGGRWEGAGSR